MQFYFQDEVWERKMTLILALDPTRFLQVSRSHGKYVFQKFIKRPTIPEAELKQYAQNNMFGIINALGAL